MIYQKIYIVQVRDSVKIHFWIDETDDMVSSFNHNPNM